MHDFNVIFDFVTQNKRVGLIFRLSENDDFANTTINYKNVSKCRHAVVDGAIDSQMLHSGCSLVLQILRKIDILYCLLHVLICNIFHPLRNSCREQANLDVVLALLAHGSQNLVNVFFKTELKHLICFIENHCLHVLEVDVSTIDVVENTTSCSNENIDSVSEFSSLIVDGNTTVNSETVELICVVLESVELV